MSVLMCIEWLITSNTVVTQGFLLLFVFGITLKILGVGKS